MRRTRRRPPRSRRCWRRLRRRTHAGRVITWPAWHVCTRCGEGGWSQLDHANVHRRRRNTDSRMSGLQAADSVSNPSSGTHGDEHGQAIGGPVAVRALSRTCLLQGSASTGQSKVSGCHNDRASVFSGDVFKTSCRDRDAQSSEGLKISQLRSWSTWSWSTGAAGGEKCQLCLACRRLPCSVGSCVWCQFSETVVSETSPELYRVSSDARSSLACQTGGLAE
eukprot:365584-Chlamydomonas_euryale.AAC.23